MDLGLTRLRGSRPAAEDKHRIRFVDEWLTEARDRLAKAAVLPGSELDLDDSDASAFLDLARIAAHESGERTNAPLLCNLVRRASRETALVALADALRREDRSSPAEAS